MPARASRRLSQDGKISLALGVITLLLVVVYVRATASLPVPIASDPLGPRAFPWLIATGLATCALALLLEGLRSTEQHGAAEEPAGAGWSRSMVAPTLIVWTGLYFWLFEPIGYVVATTLYLTPLTILLEPGRRLAAVLTSILFAIGSYVLLVRLLEVQLPAGPLPF